MPDSFSQFTHQTYCHLGKERSVFSIGQGPIVVVLHESPNPYPEVFDFGLRLQQQGFRIYIPVLFGVPNQAFSLRSTARQLSSLCISREFAVFASGSSSPIVDWLRAFCLDIQREQQQHGIGLIGMCLTGNFALGLIAEDWMLAPVLSQPSLPYAITPKLAKGLHVSKQTIDKAKQREDLEILGLRFTHDFLCPKLRFTQLRSTFGAAFRGIEINSGPFNAHNIPLHAHSIFTRDFVDENGHPTQGAFHTTLNFLSQRLQNTQL